MKLAVHETGAGPRTAVLVHGIMSDHRAWHRVGQELVDQGFRIIAVDLAGHGRSPRSRRYSPAAWADDVVETLRPLLTRRPDLIMGHSLGASGVAPVARIC
jgi:pimeloyl-ACP methyl ester carboxylesterase